MNFAKIVRYSDNTPPVKISGGAHLKPQVDALIFFYMYIILGY